MRRLAALAAAIALGVLTAAGVASGSSASKTVRSTGDQRFVPNSVLFSTVSFNPGQISVKSGDTVVWQHGDRYEEPHTVTIVAPSVLPDMQRQRWVTFECFFIPGQPCVQAILAHCGEPGFCENPSTRTFVLDPGNDGLNSPGDSVLFLHGQTASAQITAPAGSLLNYICAFHPWMQGVIKVE